MAMFSGNMSSKVKCRKDSFTFIHILLNTVLKIFYVNYRFCVSSFNSGVYQLSFSSDSEGGVKIECQAHF